MNKNDIGDADNVLEGHDIPIAKLTQSTKRVTIEKIGKGVWITDEAILSGYGDQINEGVNQLTTSIASRVDRKLLSALNENTRNVYTLGADFDPGDIPKALALFGEESEGQKAMLVDPTTYAKILSDVKDWIPASQLAAETVIRGSLGMAFGVQIIVSERIKPESPLHIIKPGALALFMKRDTLVETDRDIVNQSTLITASKLFAPYLYSPSSAIKIVRQGGEPISDEIIAVPAQNQTANGKRVSELMGNNVVIMADGKVKGNFHKVENYTGFSKDPAKQKGYFMVVHLQETGEKMSITGGTDTLTDVPFDPDVIIKFSDDGNEKSKKYKITVDKKDVVELDFSEATCEGATV